jgi:DNA-binding response OmpR family regulator
MVLVVDRDHERGVALVASLRLEGLVATHHPEPPDRADRVAVVVIRIEAAPDLGALEALRGRTLAERVLVLAPDALRVAAFEEGADDVTAASPLSRRELALRVRSLLRRSVPPRPTPAASPPTRFLRAADRSLRVAGRWLRLTQAEFDLVAVLAREPDRVWSREALVTALGGGDAPRRPRTVDTTIKRLRARLAPRGDALVTVRGVGYRLDVSRLEA